MEGSYGHAAAAPLLSAAVPARPAAFAVAGRARVFVPGTPGGAELISSEQLLIPLLPGFMCSLSNLLLLASWFTARLLTPSKRSCIQKQFWETGRSSKEMHLQGEVGWWQVEPVRGSLSPLPLAGNAAAHGTST